MLVILNLKALQKQVDILKNNIIFWSADKLKAEKQPINFPPQNPKLNNYQFESAKLSIHRYFRIILSHYYHINSRISVFFSIFV